MVSLEA
jgi:hypothetical protein